MPVRCPACRTVCRAAFRALILLTAVATPFAVAAAAEAPAAMVLFDFETTVDTARVHAQNATAAVADRDGRHVLHVTADAGAGQPAVTLRPAGGPWDLARCEGIAAEVRNAAAAPVTIYLRVENKGANDRRNTNVGLVTLAAGAAATLRVPFSRHPPKVEGVDLFGMRGYPVAGKGETTGRLDPGRVTGLRFNLESAGPPNVEIDNVRACGSAKPQPEEGLTADTFYPFIDTFGQYIHRDWPGKTHSEADLADARQAEEKDLAAHPGPANWNRFGGWADGPKFEATGFFHAVKYRGRWLLVDPDGRPFFSHGMDCVRQTAETPIDDRERWWHDFPGDRPEFQALLGRGGHIIRDYYAGKRVRTFNFALANIRRKYGEDWQQTTADLAHRRLRSWGLNTIANWSDERVYLEKKTPYVATVRFSSPPIEGSEGYWGKFKDPFYPDFERGLQAAMTREARETVGDPFCLGYFVDNEIAWGNDTSLAEAALASPADQPAKRAFLDDLQKKYRTIDRLNAAWGTKHTSWDALAASTAKPDAKRAGDDLRAFYTRLAEQYFRLCRDAVKRVAPKQMYLGCRFAWVNDLAARAGAKFCDVVSYNRYQRSVADFRLPEGVDAPVIIGEFHFGALDRGLFHTGLVPVASQEARAEAYKAYVRSAVAHPQIVGCHWFQYRDESTVGRSLDGENYQIGFVDICDRPYPETIAACREVGYALYPAAQSP
ncbi:MAG: beta-galactosidase [Planctomycetes bacterium]|nr:beta-galactosidase [Planctomycetota bacterium]